jgi:putative ABC transport system permease protein
MNAEQWRYALKLTRHHLRERAAQTALTVVVVALAVALSVAVIALADGLRRGIVQAADAFGVVIIGPKGDSQQLALNTILLQSVPLGTLDLNLYEDLRARYPHVRTAPLAMGDNVAGIPIIGTDAMFFEMRRAADQPPAFALTEGRLFEQPFEAVLGAEAARTLGVRLGEAFISGHGMSGGGPGDTHGSHPYTVVGILGRTSSAYDRAVFTPLDSVWEAHDLGIPAINRPQTDPQTADRGRITAILVMPYGVSLSEVYRIATQYNNTPEAQAIFPGAQIGTLFETFDQGQRILNVVGVLALVMAGLTLLLSLYSASLSRRGAVAIMRGLGASRAIIFATTLIEALALSLIGALSGWAAGHLAASLIAASITGYSAIPIPTRSLPTQEVPLLLAALAVGVVAGLIPALMAYRVNPIASMSATSP